MELVVGKNESSELAQRVHDQVGLSLEQLLEISSLRGAEFILDEALDDHKDIVIICGPGGNGAEGLAIGRHLATLGVSVRTFMAFGNHEEMAGPLIRQYELAKHYGVKVNFLENAEALRNYLGQLSMSPVILDCVVGPGLKQPLSSFLSEITSIINERASHIIAWDLPSGVDPQTGRAQGPTVMADITLAPMAYRTGHLLGDGPLHCGEIVKLNWPIPPGLGELGTKFFLGKKSLDQLRTKRNPFAHKNNFGHGLVVGGSPGMAGALLMAARASQKSGVGLVTAATWKVNYQELVSRVGPDIMTGMIPADNQEEYETILNSLDQFDSVGIGPGLGRHDRARFIVEQLLSHYHGPLVIDADAINSLNLEEDSELLAKRPAPTILTPHWGEFARLLGISTEDLARDTLGHLQKAIEKTHAIIVLKGPCTLIGLPSGRIYFNYYPNDGLAKGGSGDVLAGLLTGLCAQYWCALHPGERNGPKKIEEAVLMGVAVHTRAGKYAVDELGARALSPRILHEFFSKAFFSLSDPKTQRPDFDQEQERWP